MSLILVEIQKPDESYLFRLQSGLAGRHPAQMARAEILQSSALKIRVHNDRRHV